MESDCRINDFQERKSLAECFGYILDKDILSDITLVVGNPNSPTYIKAHRNILISRSEYFEELLDGLGLVHDKVSLELPANIEADIFKIILRYMYTDEAILTVNNVISMFKLAQFYKLNGLLEICQTFFEDNLSVENMCLLYGHLHRYKLDEFRDKCFKLILRYPKETLSSNDFQNLPFDCITAIIECEKLVVKEHHVHEAVIKWSDAEYQRRGNVLTDISDSKRREILGSILHKIRYPVMEKEYFGKHLYKSDLLSEEEKLSVVQDHYGVKALVKDPKINFVNRRRQRLKKTYDEIIYYGFKSVAVPHSFCFVTSDDVCLHGLSMYCCIGFGNSVYKIEIRDETENELCNFEKRMKFSAKTNINFLLETPARIIEGRKYMVKTYISNGEDTNTYFGPMDPEDVYFKNIKITFSNSRSQKHGTDVEKGQIPGLLLSSIYAVS